jgi:hypothetical protein
VDFTEVSSSFAAIPQDRGADDRMTGALVDWLKEHPGDLCDPEATRLFKAILAHVVDYFFMAHLTVELIMIEDGIPIYTDFDISWSLKPASSFNPDTNTNTNINAPQELVIDSMYELDIMSPTDLDDHEIDTPLKRLGPSTGSLLVDEETSVIMERRLSGSESRVALSSHSDRDKDKKSFIERENPSEWSAAVGWVMNHDPLEFAAELTRMQWDLFVTIRVSPLYFISIMKMMTDDRDGMYLDMILGKRKIRLLGRLLLFLIVFRDGKPFLLLDYSAQKNNPPPSRKQLTNRVSTMILASPKPKHRARIYERFTLIAHQLRRLKNYDSLYAVISGMQETSIHRLSQTHQAVQLGPGILKDWQSHLKLMDPRGGYVHYRRALQADLSHGRAAIPLV